jgi:hypothetical protein
MACSHPLEPLFQTENGFVFRCKHCKWLNICFGPVILALSESRLAQFRTLVASLEPSEDTRHDLNGRRFHLSMSDRSMGLALTEEEVTEILELLDGALAMVELDGLVSNSLGAGLS